MRALLIPVGKPCEEIEINGYADLRNAVGGTLDICSWIFDEEPEIYMNDEGKINGSLPNRAVYATANDVGKISMWDGHVIQEGELLEILYGDMVAIGLDPETGEDREITEEEIARVRERFDAPGMIESGEAEVSRIINSR